MKLIILTQYFYPEIGAPSNRLSELIKGFTKLGWEVSVITAMPNYPKGKIFSEYRRKFKCEENTDGINILRYWLYASVSAKRIPRIISMLSFSFTSLFSMFYVRKFKPDFFFVESPPLTLAFSAYILSRMGKSKLIMNVSDIWPLSAKELGMINDGFIYKKLERLEKFLYKKSLLCSGQSEEIVEHIKYRKGEGVYLFRNGVDVTRFKNSNGEAKKSDNRKFIYAGLIGVAQGIFEICRNINFKELDSEFHIYGDGAERKLLEKFLMNNNDLNIFLHKSVSREEIPELLSGFYCAIIPLVKNIYGAVPSKIYEAMASGLPVLFSGSGEGAKIIEKNRVGFVSAPKDYESLKKNILEITNSPELRNIMSIKGKEIAKEKFDRNKNIKDFSDKLISLIS